jgi:12-oxophytodienoic acid reductase
VIELYLNQLYLKVLEDKRHCCIDLLEIMSAKSVEKIVFEAAEGETLDVPAEVAPLFRPLKIGRFTLSNRVVMAPLTRCRCPGGVPSKMVAEYYGQRTTKGSLLISEATVVEPRGHGYPNTPSIYNDEHIEGWKQVAKTVKDKGGIFFCQLWHVGRASHQDFQPGDAPPVSSSALPIGSSFQVFSPKDFTMKNYPTPRALETAEVKEIVQMYRKAAKNAIDAGFDGVEIHAANGYLIAQFLEDGANLRTDEYGGSVENRARFALEIVEAVVNEVGADRVGIRVNPHNKFLDCIGSDPVTQHGYLLKELNKFNLAYVHCVEPRVLGNDDVHGEHPSLEPYKTVYKGVWMVAGGYKRETGIEAVKSGKGDLVAYGRDFIANPDIHKRFILNAPLNKYDRNTFYSQGPEGYIDYPSLKS